MMLAMSKTSCQQRDNRNLDFKRDARVSVKHVEITTSNVLQPSLLLMLLAHPVVLVLDLSNFWAI